MFTLTGTNSSLEFPGLDLGSMIIERDDTTGIYTSNIEILKQTVLYLLVEANKAKEFPIPNFEPSLDMNFITPRFSACKISEEKSQAKPAHRGDITIYYTHFICIKPKGFVLFIKYNLDNQWCISLSEERVIEAHINLPLELPSL